VQPLEIEKKNISPFSEIGKKLRQNIIVNQKDYRSEQDSERKSNVSQSASNNDSLTYKKQILGI
jgi:hypothetical protein